MIQDIAPHLLQNEYSLQTEALPVHPVYCFDGDALLVSEQDLCSLPTRAVFSLTAECKFLFCLDDVPYFLLVSGEETPEGFCFVPLRQIREKHLSTKEALFAAWTAYQLANWYKDNVFCGRCGGKTIPAEKERAIKCPDCQRMIYPRIIPAVIVGVTNGDEIILTRYNRPNAYHALIGGFVEIGEAFEDTVRREVMEEVGLKVKNIRYYKSQPWAIVDDVLCGYFCDVDGDATIRLDNVELKEAMWVKREEVDAQPDDLSLTNEMMQAFKAGKEPKR